MIEYHYEVMFMNDENKQEMFLHDRHLENCVEKMMDLRAQGYTAWIEEIEVGNRSN